MTQPSLVGKACSPSVPRRPCLRALDNGPSWNSTQTAAETAEPALSVDTGLSQNLSYGYAGVRISVNNLLKKGRKRTTYEKRRRRNNLTRKRSGLTCSCACSFAHGRDVAQLSALTPMKQSDVVTHFDNTHACTHGSRNAPRTPVIGCRRSHSTEGNATSTCCS